MPRANCSSTQERRGNCPWCDAPCTHAGFGCWACVRAVICPSRSVITKPPWNTFSHSGLQSRGLLIILWSFFIHCAVMHITAKVICILIRPLRSKAVNHMLGARGDYSLVFRAGELWPFVGDFLSGSRVMDGGAIFSPTTPKKQKGKDNQLQ